MPTGPYGGGQGFANLGAGLRHLGGLFRDRREEEALEAERRRLQEEADRNRNLALFQYTTERGGGMGAPPSFRASDQVGAPNISAPQFLNLPGGEGYIERPEFTARREAQAANQTRLRALGERVDAARAVGWGEGSKAAALNMDMPPRAERPPLTYNQEMRLAYAKQGMDVDEQGRPVRVPTAGGAAVGPNGLTIDQALDNAVNILREREERPTENEVLALAQRLYEGSPEEQEGGNPDALSSLRLLQGGGQPPIQVPYRAGAQPGLPNLQRAVGGEEPTAAAPAMQPMPATTPPPATPDTAAQRTPVSQAEWDRIVQRQGQAYAQRHFVVR